LRIPKFIDSLSLWERVRVRKYVLA